MSASRARLVYLRDKAATLQGRRLDDLRNEIEAAARTLKLIRAWERRERYYQREIEEWDKRGGPKPRPVRKPKPTRAYNADEGSR